MTDLKFTDGIDVDFSLRTDLIGLAAGSDNCTVHQIEQVQKSSRENWIVAQIQKRETSINALKAFALEHNLKVVGYEIGKNASPVTVLDQIDAPENFAITPDAEAGDTILDLSWDEVDGASGYIVEQASDEDFSDAVEVYNDEDAGVTIEELTAETEYFFRVRTKSATLANSAWVSDSAETEAAG